MYNLNKSGLLWQISPGGWRVTQVGPRGREFDSRTQHLFFNTYLMCFN